MRNWRQEFGRIGQDRGSRSGGASPRRGRSRNCGSPGRSDPTGQRRDRARARSRLRARSPDSRVAPRGHRHGRGGVEVLGPQLDGGDFGLARQRRQHVVEDTPGQGEPVGDLGHDRGASSKGVSRGPRGGVSSPQLKGASRSTSTNRARSRSVDPLMGMTVRRPTSRIRWRREILTVSGSSPKAGVAMPPGAARRPNRPLTTKRRRARTWAATLQRGAGRAGRRHGTLGPTSRGPGDVVRWHGQRCDGAGGLSSSSKATSST